MQIKTKLWGSQTTHLASLGFISQTVLKKKNHMIHILGRVRWARVRSGGEKAKPGGWDSQKRVTEPLKGGSQGPAWVGLSGRGITEANLSKLSD